MNRFWEKWVSMVIYIRDIRNSLSSFYQRTSKTLLYVLSHVQLFATPWTVACKAPLSMEFFRQVYWVGYYSLLSMGSSHPRDRTQVSFITGRFFMA